MTTKSTLLVLDDPALELDDPRFFVGDINLVILTLQGGFECLACDLTVGDEFDEPDPPCAHVTFARETLAEPVAALLRQRPR